MKNVLIMGVGRAGKTTLSHMLKDKVKTYNLIHSDSIKWGIIRGKGEEKYYRTNIKEQKEFEHSEFFQKTLLEIFNSLANKDNNEYGYILEAGQLQAKTVSEMIDFDKTIVICLGLGNLTKEEIIKLCREHDTEKDWSYNMPYEYLEAHAAKWYETNEEFKIECPKYGIKYIDTTKDRKQALNEALEYITSKIY